MKIKKMWIYAVLITMLAVFGGCGVANNTDDKINIVCTNFPAYDFVMNIIGTSNENIEVTYLLEKGVDMHNYQASADSIAKIMKADLCVYVGGESEAWVEDVLENKTDNDKAVVRFMDVVELKEETIVDGMEHEHEDDEHADEGNDRSAGVEDGHVHEVSEVVYDEHVWLSLKNAVSMVNSLCEAIMELDSDNAEMYSTNAKKYTDKLVALDEQFKTLTGEADNKVIVVADRFPFLYLAEDYGIEYFAAFPGCSAETEAGFETIAFLAEKVKENKVPVVFKIETSNGALAETVISASGESSVKTGTLDSMQSVSKSKIADGYSYISAMQANLSALKEALR